MCTNWKLKHEIMGQLLWLFPLLAVIAMMMVPSVINHPVRSSVIFVGFIIGGGIYIWKRKR